MVYNCCVHYAATRVPVPSLLLCFPLVQVRNQPWRDWKLEPMITWSSLSPPASCWLASVHILKWPASVRRRLMKVKGNFLSAPRAFGNPSQRLEVSYHSFND